MSAFTVPIVSSTDADTNPDVADITETFTGQTNLNETPPPTTPERNVNQPTIADFPPSTPVPNQPTLLEELTQIVCAEHLVVGTKRQEALIPVLWEEIMGTLKGEKTDKEMEANTWKIITHLRRYFDEYRFNRTTGKDEPVSAPILVQCKECMVRNVGRGGVNCIECVVPKSAEQKLKNNRIRCGVVDCVGGCGGLAGGRHKERESHCMRCWEDKIKMPEEERKKREDKRINNIIAKQTPNCKKCELPSGHGATTRRKCLCHDCYERDILKLSPEERKIRAEKRAYDHDNYLINSEKRKKKIRERIELEVQTYREEMEAKQRDAEDAEYPYSEEEDE